jgi:hypothetical protein
MEWRVFPSKSMACRVGRSASYDAKRSDATPATPRADLPLLITLAMSQSNAFQGLTVTVY